jgi:hypothetical protein
MRPHQPNLPGVGSPLKWRRLVRAFIRSHFRPGDEFTADDVREGCWMANIPEPPEPNAWGGIFRELGQDGEAEWTGIMTRSRLKKSKGRLIRVWRMMKGGH